MKPETFRMILQSAMDGSHDGLTKILEIYAPLIKKYSWINGKFDEDLKQYILIHIALNISKFNI